jgi:hypothetical protein
MDDSAGIGAPQAFNKRPGPHRGGGGSGAGLPALGAGAALGRMDSPAPVADEMSVEPARMPVGTITDTAVSGCAPGADGAGGA